MQHTNSPVLLFWLELAFGFALGGLVVCTTEDRRAQVQLFIIGLAAFLFFALVAATI